MENMDYGTETEKVKSNRIKALEQSLIEFLSNKRDLEEKMGTGYRRIRSIQLSFNEKNPNHITFIVQIGMFAAEFNMSNGLKEKGSCFGIERYIRDWSERDSVKFEMMSITNLNSVGPGGNQMQTNVRNLLR